MQRIFILLSVVLLVACQTNKKPKQNESMNVYSNAFFSIYYPQNWKVVEKPDQMSDVYIGSDKEMLGFTVLHFDTDEPLDVIVKEGNSNIENMGETIASNEKIEINGYTGYKTVITYRYNDMQVKQISYTFKERTFLFNVRFGNNASAIDRNTIVIDNIIKSLKIK